jgi:very-short-patch-repair endonuclease
VPRLPPLPSRAVAQHGTLTRAQALEEGWSNKTLAAAVAAGVLVRRHADVFVLCGARGPGTEDWAAFLAGGPQAVLAGWSASRRLGWEWPQRRAGPPCVCVPVDQHVRLAGVAVLRWALSATDVVRNGELRWTRPARTVVDCLRLAPPPLRESMLDAALLRGWLTVDELRAEVGCLAGHPGVVDLRRLLAGVDTGARSVAERLGQRVLERTGLQGWRWNYAVALPDGSTAVVDAALPELRIAVEIDGRAFHVDADTFQRDRTRQNHMVGLGWTVLRFTWWDLTHRPEYVVRVVLQAAARAS